MRWKWAEGFLVEYDQAEKATHAALSDHASFIAELKASALSAESMRALKKKYGEEYVTMLTAFNVHSKTAVTNMLNIISKVDKMAAALFEDLTPDKQTVGKKRKTAAAACK